MGHQEGRTESKCSHPSARDCADTSVLWMCRGIKILSHLTWGLSPTQWWRLEYNAKVEFLAEKVGVLMNHLRCRTMNVQTFSEMF